MLDFDSLLTIIVFISFRLFNFYYLFSSKVKGFKDYVDLYLRGVKNTEGEQPKVVHEICNPRWEICVTVSDNGFQQASFVNSIATTKVHLSYIFASKIG